MPGDSGCWISAEPILKARLAPLHHHHPTEMQRPQSCHCLGVPAAPLAGDGGGAWPTSAPCLGPHPSRKLGWGGSPGSPSAGGTGTRRLRLTKPSSVLFSPVSPRHRKAVTSPDLRRDKRSGLGRRFYCSVLWRGAGWEERGEPGAGRHT